MNQLPAAIIVESGVDNGRVIPLLQARIVIGREKTNHVALSDNQASREHASISQEDGRFLLHDLKSTNGTWLNDQRIQTPQPLQHGDQIKIGDTFLRFNANPGPETLNHLLMQMRLFAGLDDATLNQLVAQASIRRFDPYEKITVEQLQNNFFVILSGELVVNTAATNTILIRKSYTGGAYFDATQIIRPDSFFVASQETWLLALNRSQIDELIITFIHQTPFDGLPEDRLQAIAEQMSIESYAPDRWLFQQGDYADALYVVVFGKVAMMRHSPQSEQKTMDDEIRTYKRGSLFGELGLLAGDPRAASALIKEETALLILPRDRFNALVDLYPDISVHLYRYIANLLEEQSAAFWKAARDVEKMQDLLQSTKMAALGQLVAGIAHEINTPVGSISANSYQLGQILADTQSHLDGLPEQITALARDDAALQRIAGEVNIPLDEKARAFIGRYTAELINHLQAYDENDDLALQFSDMGDISAELGEAAQRIKVIVKNLANFARLDEAERKTVDIHEGLDATLSLLHHELKYQVDVIKEYGRLPKLTCHPNELNQVFMNIIMNAIQALNLSSLPTGARGMIRIKTYREGETAVIAITDNGKGISPENMTRIFEPFFSTKGAAAAAGGLGLGLGLAISRKIVEEKHNGRISVASKPGHGATFYIRLPLDKAPSDTTTQTLILEQLKQKIS